MRTLETLHEEIRDCRKCFPEGGNRPVVSPIVRSKAVVIGQAPSLTDSRTGRPFSGPGGKRLMDWMRRAGLDESDIYFSALTKCYPGRSPSGKGDRTPNRIELANCRPHLSAELDSLKPRLILLVGGMAIREFLDNRPLKEVVGKVFPLFNSWAVPLPHCSGASLWLNDSHHQALLERAIQQMRHLLTHDKPFSEDSET